MISIAHKIELKPNNKQKTYFRKAFGCARLAWNWGLSEWERRYNAGESRSAITLNNAFNAIKKEQFPFVYEVTKYACQQSFRDLARAYSSYFKKLSKRPKFKKKKDGEGSFYVCGEQIRLTYINENSKALKKMKHNEKQKHQYLKVPNLGCVRMTECLRFNGKIKNVRISTYKGRYFASFTLDITKQEYQAKHRIIERQNSIGIDLGIKHNLIFSNGICIDNPKPLSKRERIITRLSRQLSKRTHAKTKQERLQGVKQSNNYRKLQKTLSKHHAKVANIRHDFVRKVTSIISSTYSEIVIENLNVQGLMKNRRMAKALMEASFGFIISKLKNNAERNGISLTQASRWYPSSKTCFQCGNVKKILTLNERMYHCECCGALLDRDYNAALNLHSLVRKNSVGTVHPEFTPADLTALLSLFHKNGMTTSKVETGNLTLADIAM